MFTVGQRLVLRQEAVYPELRPGQDRGAVHSVDVDPHGAVISLMIHLDSNEYLTTISPNEWEAEAE